MSTHFSPTEGSRLTRRGYLILKAIQETGVGVKVAIDAVESVARDHPDWDLDAKKTWAEWESSNA